MPTPKHPLNVLWHSNASHYPSGFGTQTRQITWRLVDRGYGVVVSAYVGLEGAPIKDEHGILQLPHIREAFTNDFILTYYNLAQSYLPKDRPTIVFSLLDIFALKPEVWQNLPHAAWSPVDCHPILQNEREQFKTCRWPIAMSRFAEAEMKAIGLDPIYIPHGTDSSIYAPMDRTAARWDMLNRGLITQPIFDDKFLVIIVGANGHGPRKNFAGMLESFQMFSAEHPDALLYIHADSEGVFGSPLAAMVAQLDLTGKVLFPPPVAIVGGLVPDNLLRSVYNAGDVKLMLSLGEGSGLTDAEAMACGTPIVGTHYAATPELNTTGWQVDGMLYQAQDLSYQMRCDSAQAAAHLDDAYKVWKSGNMPDLRARTRQAALAYDVETVLDTYFIPALDRMAEELTAEPQRDWLLRRYKALGRSVDMLAAPTQTWNGLTLPTAKQAVPYVIGRGERHLNRRERRVEAAKRR